MLTKWTCLDDDDVIEIVNEIKGGPNSAAFVGNKKVQKTELENRILTNITSDSERVSSKNRSTQQRRRRKNLSPVLSSAQRPNKSTHNEMMEITRQTGVTEKIRKAVMNTYEYKEDKLYDDNWIFLFSYDFLFQGAENRFRDH